MEIVTRIADLEHPVGVTTGFVPTMGGFHEGHLELMRTARRETDRVVVSLFVNPTQFGAGEDFERYPRNHDRDAALAEDQGVDVLFVPTVEEVYPRVGTSIHVPVVTSHWEGASRPGHFEGVATVVCKLFNIVRPNIAYFGQKDLQQCRVVTRMVEDLNMPLRLSIQPTVRESDGLAMSSRNAYLTSEERDLAPAIYRELTHCKELLGAPGISGSDIEASLKCARTALEDEGFRVDYFDLIDLETTHSSRNLSKRCAIIAAAKLGNTRLIDNILV